VEWSLADSKLEWSLEFCWLELSENVMAVDKHFQKDIEMLQMT
jgi:hypothetical protein